MNWDLGCGKVYPLEFTPSLANMEDAQIAQWVKEGDDVGKDAGDNAPQEGKKFLERRFFFIKVSSEKISFY